MVASLERDTTVKTACGFPFLKPVAQPQVIKPKRKIGRWLGAACAAVNACVVAGALYLSQVPRQTPVVQQPAKGQDALLYEYLGSDEFLDWQAQYQRDRTAELLAEAQETREEANEMMIEASLKLDDSVLPYGPNSELGTTTEVQISCRKTEDGWTASIVQLSKEYPNGTVGRLASCNAGRVKPGGTIGTTGDRKASIRTGL